MTLTIDVPVAADRHERSKITDITVGPRWRVKHIAAGKACPATGTFDIVGAADEGEAMAKVQAAYSRPRVFISAERLD